MGSTNKKNYRVIVTAQVRPFISQEHVLAGTKDLTIGEIHDWLEHIGKTVGPTGKICIAKALNGFETPGMVPENE